MLAVDMAEETGGEPHLPQQQHHTLEWHIASYTVPARNKGRGRGGGDPPQKPGASEDGSSGTRTILKGLAGRAVGGELVAVMGPSGAIARRGLSRVVVLGRAYVLRVWFTPLLTMRIFISHRRGQDDAARMRRAAEPWLRRERALRRKALHRAVRSWFMSFSFLLVFVWGKGHEKD